MDHNRMPLSLVALCKKKFIMMDIDRTVHVDLILCREKVESLRSSQHVLQSQYDQLERNHQTELSLLRDQLRIKDHIIKSLQDRCDWWSRTWRTLDYDHRNLQRSYNLVRLQSDSKSTT